MRFICFYNLIPQHVKDYSFYVGKSLVKVGKTVFSFQFLVFSLALEITICDFKKLKAA